MAYVDETFPEEIAKGSRGGPRMSLFSVDLDSGAQERSRRWPVYRWEFDVGVGIKKLSQLDDAYNHYLAVGVENSFPYKDLHDFTSASDNRSPPASSGTMDQIIGIGDGVKATFQLGKTYTFGQRNYARAIRKPVSGTITVSVAGTIKTLGTQYTVNFSTGEITFTGGNIPTNPQIIRASFEFRVPVFYGLDFNYKTSLDAVDAGRLPDMTLVEDVTQGTITPEFMYQGGGDTITFGVDTPYDYAWGSSVVLDPTVTPLSIILPDINELPFGGPYLWFYNKGTAKTINFKNKATLATEFSLTGGTGAAVVVRRDTADARFWTAF